MVRLRTLFLLLASLVPGSAVAHDMWIEPSEFSPRSGEPVPIGLWIGHGEERDPVSRQEERIVRFELVTPDGETRSIERVAGGHPAGYVRPEDQGSHAVVYVSDALAIELEPDEFETYLREEGLDEVLRMRSREGESSKPGLERYSRSLKSLLAVGGGPPESRVAGLPLELVLHSLAAAESGHRVELELSFRGEPVTGALVSARALDDPGAKTTDRQDRRTDEKGRVVFTMQPGKWLVATTHMERDVTGIADWRSYWTTLTFALPETGIGDDLETSRRGGGVGFGSSAPPRSP